MILFPEKPITAESATTPVNLSKLNKDASIDLAVFSISTMLPFLSPSEGELITPKTLIVPS